LRSIGSTSRKNSSAFREQRGTARNGQQDAPSDWASSEERRGILVAVISETKKLNAAFESFKPGGKSQVQSLVGAIHAYCKAVANLRKAQGAFSEVSYVMSLSDSEAMADYLVAMHLIRNSRVNASEMMLDSRQSIVHGLARWASSVLPASPEECRALWSSVGTTCCRVNPYQPSRICGCTLTFRLLIAAPPCGLETYSALLAQFPKAGYRTRSITAPNAKTPMSIMMIVTVMTGV
jgi:hypothetical protein